MKSKTGRGSRRRASRRKSAMDAARSTDGIGSLLPGLDRSLSMHPKMINGTTDRDLDQWTPAIASSPPAKRREIPGGRGAW